MAGNSNIEKFHTTRKINFATIAFAVIFIYMLVWLITGLKTEKVVGYQVKKGSLAANRIYNGIAIRNENIVTTDYTGYVSYFLNEGERAAYNNLVYCIDETGKLSDLTGKDPSADSALASSELNSLRLDLQLFCKNFDERVFSTSNTIQNKVNSQLTQLQNRRIIDNVSSINSAQTSDIIDYVRADSPGIVLYYIDGYEDYLASDLTKEDFDIDKYESQIILNDTLLQKGDFVYKYVFDENWSIAIFVTNEELDRIQDEGQYVEVKFSKNQTTSWGQVNVIKSYDDETLIELKFTNSMVSFCEDRFVEIELLLDDENGLKIPNSAIVEMPFFLIKEEYIKKEDGAYKVLRQEPGVDDSVSPKYVEVEVYKYDSDEKVYYVEESSVKRGDVLRKFDSAVKGTENTMVVGAEGTLPGVYNINMGFADFKLINILHDNEQYSIVDANINNGIRAYDYIALDGSLVNDKDFVY